MANHHVPSQIAHGGAVEWTMWSFVELVEWVEGGLLEAVEHAALVEWVEGWRHCFVKAAITAGKQGSNTRTGVKSCMCNAATLEHAPPTTWTTSSCLLSAGSVQRPD
jgi:hypothetical protein